MTFGFSIVKRIVILAALAAAVVLLTYPLVSSWWTHDGEEFGNFGTLDPSVVATMTTPTSRVAFCSQHLDAKTGQWVVDRCY